MLPWLKKLISKDPFLLRNFNSELYYFTFLRQNIFLKHSIFFSVIGDSIVYTTFVLWQNNCETHLFFPSPETSPFLPIRPNIHICFTLLIRHLPSVAEYCSSHLLASFVLLLREYNMVLFKFSRDFLFIKFLQQWQPKCFEEIRCVWLCVL